MEVAWDMWNQQCKWPHRDNNPWALKAIEHLNAAIQEEHAKSHTDLSDSNKYLYDYDLMDLFAMTVDQRQNWLQAVEAAQGGIPLSLTYNEMSAEAQPDKDIQVEYKKPDTDVPDNLKHLLQQKLGEILNMNF